ncbi:hypothetical protein J3F84DRAFT_221293 [Trichoderma pleuroticola]
METTRVLLRPPFVGDSRIDFTVRQTVVTAATEPLAWMQLDWKIMTRLGTASRTKPRLPLSLERKLALLEVFAAAYIHLYVKKHGEMKPSEKYASHLYLEGVRYRK